jgi:formiminoglutamase
LRSLVQKKLMNHEFLTPVEDTVIAHLLEQSPDCLGRNIQIHSKKEGFPSLENVQIVLFGVQEDRNSQGNVGCGEY